MARQGQEGTIQTATRVVGDTADAAVRTTGAALNATKNTATYTASLLNRDGAVGAALGLAAGAAIGAIALPLMGLSTLALGIPALAAGIGCGACAGLAAGGTIGKRRLHREHTHGATVKAPSVINKEAMIGFGLGATGLALALAPVTAGLSTAGAVASSSLALSAAILPVAASILPVTGAYLGSKLGMRRMAKEYQTAHSVSFDKRANHLAEKAQHAHTTQRPYTIDAHDPDWQEAKSLMRDSNSNPTQGSHAAKILADRAAAQQAIEQGEQQA